MDKSYSWAILALTVGLSPASSAAQEHVTTVFFTTGNERSFGAAAPSARCPPPVTVERAMGGAAERITMPLLDCDGRPRPEAIVAVSVLIRPRTVARPTDEELEAFDPGARPGFVAEGVRSVHPGLLERLQRLGEMFEGHTIRIYSGYRPRSPDTSRHHHARAVDLTVEGVERERVRDAALALPRTGVGWYPNSVFVHIDVREESHYWVDVSGPGEPPAYVRGAVPPPPSAAEIDAMLRGLAVPVF